MQHLVTHDRDGSTVYERFDDLDAAVAHIERLRNVDGVTDVSLYRLEPVPFEVRPWYRVEIAGSSSQAPTGAPVASAQVVPPPPPPPPSSDLFAPVTDAVEAPPLVSGERAAEPAGAMVPGVDAGAGETPGGGPRRGLFGR
ncbi:MAG: hypothetical protein D6683_09880 [Actinomyces sp.]|nr:MAG: hypothetical protein D6683_09880 [Actinomyces sp.]